MQSSGCLRAGRCRGTAWTGTTSRSWTPSRTRPRRSERNGGERAMERRHRVLALVFAIAIAVPGIYIAVSFLSARQQVTIATYRQTASLPVWIAQDMGFFRNRGLDVQLLEFSGAGLAAHVLVTGGADIGGMPTVLALQNVEAGLTLRPLPPTAELRARTPPPPVPRSLPVSPLGAPPRLNIGI